MFLYNNSVPSVHVPSHRWALMLVIAAACNYYISYVIMTEETLTLRCWEVVIDVYQLHRPYAFLCTWLRQKQMTSPCGFKQNHI